MTRIPGGPYVESPMRREAKRLIDIYDRQLAEQPAADDAAAAVARYASVDRSILRMVMESAERYIQQQKTDGDPYWPNSFTVLGKLPISNTEAFSFLRELAKREQGIIAKYEIRRALESMAAWPTG